MSGDRLAWAEPGVPCVTVDGYADRGTTAYCPPFVPMHDLIEPGESGGVRLDSFAVTREAADLENIRAMFSRRAGIMPGRYARLTRDGTLWMTDTPHERGSNLSLYRAATGDVLILGLGLGMLPAALARKPEVSHVTIVEIDPVVIEVMLPTIARVAPNAYIVQGDAFLPERLDLPRVRDGGGFDTILADVWPTICADDYAEHIAMRRAWRAWKRPGGKHVTWAEDTVARMHHQDRREEAERLSWVRRRVEPEPTANQQATAFLARKRAPKEAQA